MRARKGKPSRRCRDRASCRTSVLLASSAFLRSSRSFCSSLSTLASTSARDSSSASGRSAGTPPLAACASPSGFVCRIEVGGKGERRESLGETATFAAESHARSPRMRAGNHGKAETRTSTLTSAMVARRVRAVNGGTRSARFESRSASRRERPAVDRRAFVRNRGSWAQKTRVAGYTYKPFPSEHTRARSERSRAPASILSSTRAPRGRPHRRVRLRRRGAATGGLATATASSRAPRRTPSRAFSV